MENKYNLVLISLSSKKKKKKNSFVTWYNVLYIIWYSKLCSVFHM